MVVLVISGKQKRRHQPAEVGLPVTPSVNVLVVDLVVST
jgi:hypothetical protein